MASKRRLRRKACGDKQRHDSEDAAKRHAIHLRKKTEVYYQTYKCKFCGKWHIGRPDRKTKQALRAKALRKW
jgi:rubrerythrin